MTIVLATAPEPVDFGHLVPDDVWAEIVAGATARVAQLDLPSVGLTAIDRTITARSHGGAMLGGPRLGVVHSAETPLQAGYAYSIAANWFATKATTSATVMIDPAETIRLLPDNVVAYHCGPRANGFTVGAEQAGYARFTRADWLTPAGRAQMRRLAEYMVDVWRRWGIPLRWATDAQIRAAATGGSPQGWCVHDDIRRVLGGTTHTDPRPNYPQDDVMALAISIAGSTPIQEDDVMNANQERVLQETANAVGLLISVAARPLEAEARIKAELGARIDACTELLRQQAENDGQPFDLEAVRAVVKDAVRDGIESIETTVRFGASSAPSELQVAADRLSDALLQLRDARVAAAGTASA